MKLVLTNSLTKKKEIFSPQKPGTVSMYVCGITPYDYSHLGHGRAYVNFDVLVRLLKSIGYKVNYIRNLTDIDDKIINKAIAEGNPNSYAQVATRYIDAYHQDMALLNCVTPDAEPRVTQYIKEIISFIQGLVAKNCAYIVDGDVYFDISSFNSYGKLSGRKLDELEAGARVDVDSRKKNAGDFALWKGNEAGKFWESPWGYGRPGWHIECSVMAKALLGETFDIHGGGMDLIFPHHENEIAQSESLHDTTFARFWLHNAFINVNKEKMSKSLGNFLTLRDAFQTIDPMVFRFFLLQHHYRTPIDFNLQDVQGAGVAYKKIIAALAAVPAAAENNYADYQVTRDMLEALCDDLNTPKFLGLLFEYLKKMDTQTAALVKKMLQSILGLTLQPLPETTVEITPEIQALIEKREQARKEKNWAVADETRDKLKQLGYEPQDKKL
jgi:cysteinyl-tRNA synthetase